MSKIMDKNQLIEGLLEFINDERDLNALKSLIIERRYDEQFREIERQMIMDRDAEKEIEF